MMPSLRVWLLVGTLVTTLGLGLTAKAFYHAKEAAEAKAEILEGAVARAQASVTRSLNAVKIRDQVLQQREIDARDLSAALIEARRKLREAYKNDQATAEWAPRRVPDAFLDGLRVRPGRRDGSGADPATGAPAAGETGT